MFLKKITLVASSFLVLGIAPVFAACDVAFADVETILAKRCVACHNNTSPGEELSLQKGSVYENLVGVMSVQLDTMPRVTPGDLENSYLYLKLVGTHEAAGGYGAAMPLGGQLRDRDMDPIVNWISECGASAE